MSGARHISKLIAGLQLIEDAVVGVSFYDNKASLELSRELEDAVVEELKELGFSDYSAHYSIVPERTFAQAWIFYFPHRGQQ